MLQHFLIEQAVWELLNVVTCTLILVSFQDILSKGNNDLSDFQLNYNNNFML